MSCGVDTDTETMGTARFVKVNSPRMYANPDEEIWHADIDIVFTDAPVDLEVEIHSKDRSEEVTREQDGEIVVQYLSFHTKNKDWEQDGEIVTLHFVFSKMILGIPFDADFPPLTYFIEVTLIWETGRKKLEIELNPSHHIATIDFLNWLKFNSDRE